MPGGYTLDLSADIDWANALPPHLVRAPPPVSEAQRVNSHNPTMIFNFPLPEDHPSLQPTNRHTNHARRTAATQMVAGSDASSGQRQPVASVAPLVVRAHGSRRELMRMREQEVHAEWTEDPQARRMRLQLQQRLEQEEHMRRQQQQEVEHQQQRERERERERHRREETTRQRPAPPHHDLYRELLEAQEAMQREAETAVPTAILGPSPSTALPPRIRGATPPPPAGPPPPPAGPPGILHREPSVSPQRPPPVPAATGTSSPAVPQARPTLPVATGRRRGPGGAGGGQWELQDFSYEALLELGSMAVSTGLDKKQLERMKPVAYAGCASSKFRRGRVPSASGSREAGGSGRPERTLEECAVCIEEISLGSKVIELGCHHTFHFECIIPWLARTNRCPTCRFEIIRK
jgi:hypothetical protein